MGVVGGMFPGRKLDDTGGEDGDGRSYRPRFEIDLDSGVVRLPVPPGDHGRSTPVEDAEADPGNGPGSDGPGHRDPGGPDPGGPDPGGPDPGGPDPGGNGRAEGGRDRPDGPSPA